MSSLFRSTFVALHSLPITQRCVAARALEPKNSGVKSKDWGFDESSYVTGREMA